MVEGAGTVAYVPLDLERPNLTPGFLPLVNSTPARSSASRIAPSVPNDGLPSSCSQSPTAAIPTPASLANLACEVSAPDRHLTTANQLE